MASGTGGPTEGDEVDAPLLGTVARNVPIVLFALDEDGVFTRSEGRGLAALGLEQNEVVGESVFDVYADYPEIRRAAERALDGENVTTVHEIEDTAFETWYRPMDDGRVLGVSVDVTDRVKHERLMERLNEANRRLLSAGSKQAVADMVVEIAQEVLDQPYTGVWFYESERDELVSVAGDGPAREYRDRVIGADAVEMDAYRSGEVRLFEDYRRVDHPAFPEASVGTLLLLPLGDHGLLSVASPDVVEIEPAERDLIEILARDATGALDRATREQALEHLHAATRAFMAAETKAEIARRTVDTTEEILGHPKAVVRLLSEDGDRLEPVARSDWIRENLPDRPSFRAGEGSIGGAFERGEVMRFDRSELSALGDEGATQTLLCLPLGDHGVLSIGEADESAFDDSDVQLAKVLASNVEAALDRIDHELELERRNERLDQFAEIVSHDLRNPLNVVAGRVDVAGVEEPHRTSIETAIGRMRSIIDDVLALARQGRVVSDPEPTDVREVAAFAWSSVETAEATLAVETDRWILADEERLQQLLENLIRNSVEHGPDDVSIRIGDVDGGFYLEDDGPGIPADVRDSIFDAGYSTAEAGTGLGLAIVDEIAGAHGWTVAVEDGPDGGARFSITGVETARASSDRD